MRANKTSTCTYCGGPLPKSGRGLDRLDSSKGYTADNTVPCCTGCNVMRGGYLSYEMMLELSPKLHTWRKAGKLRDPRYNARKRLPTSHDCRDWMAVRAGRSYCRACRALGRRIGESTN